MMNNFKKEYLQLRERMWQSFEELVRKGAKLTAVDTCYPRGVNPPDLITCSEGDSYFLAMEIIANENYGLHQGEDIIVGTNEVQFKDSDGNIHTIEPDILNLYWLSEILDCDH